MKRVGLFYVLCKASSFLQIAWRDRLYSAFESLSFLVKGQSWHVVT